jgi:hypothetical protein
MKTYVVPSFSKLDPTALGLTPSGGTRKKYFLFNKTKRRKNKS